jgi:transposase
LELQQEQWVKQVEKWKQSGLSKSEFCRREGINRGTFATWYRRYKERAEKPSDGFVQIRPSSSPSEQSERPQKIECIEITAGKFTVRLPNNAGRQLIEDVLGALEAHICS